MREVCVGIGLFMLGLFADFFIEHTVSRAPKWLPRLLAGSFIPIGVFVVLLSDLLWPHWWGSRANPIASTAIVATAAAVVVGSLWWFMIASHPPTAAPKAQQEVTARQPTAAEIASELARHLPNQETVSAHDFSDAVVTKAKPYPEIESAIAGSTAELFLVNRTAAPLKVSVCIIPHANRFDQNTLTSRPMPPPRIDLGQIAAGDRKGLTKVELTNEDEEAVLVSAVFGAAQDFTRPLSYRVYFRKPAEKWQFEYTLHDSYERRKLLQRGGTPENATERRRRVRFKLSQLIMHGAMLKQGFTWLVQPAVNGETGQRIDPTQKLAKMSLEIQAWTTEAVFWVQWALGEEYAARLSNPTQSTQYPRGIENVAASDLWRDRWDELTGIQGKLEEFLKEMPEL